MTTKAAASTTHPPITRSLPRSITHASSIVSRWSASITEKTGVVTTGGVAMAAGAGVRAGVAARAGRVIVRAVGGAKATAGTGGTDLAATSAMAGATVVGTAIGVMTAAAGAEG